MKMIPVTKAVFEYLLFLIAFTAPVLAYEEKCGATDVSECFGKVQTFLRLTQLPYLTEERQLDNLCQQAIGGYNCSTKLFNYQNCLSPKDKELLPIFISMAQYMFKMLCGNMRNVQGYLREAYLAYSGCILENKGKMDCCVEQSAVPDLPVMRMLDDSGKNMATKQIQTCCPVTRYIQCTNRVAFENCGERAANFTEHYIRRAAGEKIQAACQNMPGYPLPDPTACPSAGPDDGQCALIAGAAATSGRVWMMAVVVLGWVMMKGIWSVNR